MARKLAGAEDEHKNRNMDPRQLCRARGVRRSSHTPSPTRRKILVRWHRSATPPIGSSLSGMLGFGVCGPSAALGVPQTVFYVVLVAVARYWTFQSVIPLLLLPDRFVLLIIATLLGLAERLAQSSGWFPASLAWVGLGACLVLGTMAMDATCAGWDLGLGVIIFWLGVSSWAFGATLTGKLWCMVVNLALVVRGHVGLGLLGLAISVFDVISSKRPST